VAVRQQPATANGVIFITMEDETGYVNVIIRPEVLRAQRREVLGTSLPGVYGVWPHEGEVRHLVAQRLLDLSALLGCLSTGSGNFC